MRVAEHGLDLVERQAELVCSKLREDRIGASADVLRGAGHASRAVVAQLDRRGAGEAHRLPGAGRHSPAERQAVALHRCHARIALRPAELLRAGG